MRIFHLCSVRVFRAEISDETQSMRSEKLFIKRSKQYTFWHNITTTSPTLDQNQTPVLLLSTVYFLVMRLSQKSVCARQAANRITHGVMESAAAEHQQQPIAQHVLSPWRVVRHVMAVKTMKSGSGKGSYKYYYN